MMAEKTSNSPERPTVLITRPLAEDGDFYTQLASAGCTPVGCSLLQFSTLPIAELPGAEWYFFYSTQGVRSLLQQHLPPAGVRLATLGPSAAAELAKAGYKVDYCGNGQPDAVPSEFARQVLPGQKVAFFQAKNSRRSVASQLLPAQIAAELPVYDNAIVPQHPPLPLVRCAVLTSPLNAEAFLRYYPASSALPPLIAIGHTTAAWLQQRELPTIIAPMPDEAALAQCVLELIGRQDGYN